MLGFAVEISKKSHQQLLCEEQAVPTRVHYPEGSQWRLFVRVKVFHVSVTIFYNHIFPNHAMFCSLEKTKYTFTKPHVTRFFETLTKSNTLSVRSTKRKQNKLLHSLAPKH
eukprot:m.203009 g.203009  ORF g.203009 m.203009 type:complete len:111 (-) comp15755_c0_seq29:1665-1997(-)